LKRKPPIVAAIGKISRVVHKLLAKTPMVAEARFQLKKVATSKVVKGPPPGTIPKKTPSAKPAAMLWGVSLSVKKCRKKFLIFCQSVAIDIE